MRVIEILTGLTGGFLIELIFMRLSDRLIGRLLRSDGVKGKILIFTSIRNMITLLLLMFAAMHSIAMMLSMGAGSLIYIYVYAIMKGIQIKKTL